MITLKITEKCKTKNGEGTRTYLYNSKEDRYEKAVLELLKDENKINNALDATVDFD